MKTSRNGGNALIKFNTLLFSLLGLILSVPSYAEKGWIHSVKVDKIVVVVNGGINVKVRPDLTACTSQSGYGSNYASVYPDHPGKDQILSVLLAAKMADQQVGIWLSDDSCRIGEVVLGGF